MNTETFTEQNFKLIGDSFRKTIHNLKPESTKLITLVGWTTSGRSGESCQALSWDRFEGEAEMKAGREFRAGLTVCSPAQRRAGNSFLWRRGLQKGEEPKCISAHHPTYCRRKQRTERGCK